MHPARGADFPDYKTEAKSKYEIWWTFGWPYETSAAMSRIVFSGMFDRHPNLKIVTHHMGGMIPYFEGRVGYGWDVLGSRTSDEDYVSLRQSMKKRPIDYFRNFYADTALFGGQAATKCGLDFFGVDHCRFRFRRALRTRSPASIFARPSAASRAWTSAPPRSRRFTEGNARRLLNLV